MKAKAPPPNGNGEAKIDNDLLKGDYKRNDLFFFALNANWKF